MKIFGTRFTNAAIITAAASWISEFPRVVVATDGGSFLEDVVDIHYKNKNKNNLFTPRSFTQNNKASSISSSSFSSFAFSPEREQEQQQQQRRLKYSKKMSFPPTSAPAPTMSPTFPPPPPGTIDPVCYPENYMNKFDFTFDDGLPMALSPGGSNTGDSTGYLNWNFNRGMSAVMVGGAYSSSGSSTNNPTLYTIVASGQGGPDGTTTGVNIAAAQFSEVTGLSGSNSLSYDATSVTNQLSGNFGTMVTTVTFIPPYEYNQQYQSWQPNTSNLETIYFLVGLQSGLVYMCSITPGTNGLTPTCDEPFSNLGLPNDDIVGNISEILYIPQINAVVIMTFSGAFLSYTITFDGETPTIGDASQNTQYENTDICSYCDYCLDCASQALFSPRSVAAVYVDDETTYLYAAGLYPTDCFNNIEYGAGGTIVVFNVNGTDPSLPITYVGTIENTFYAYQIVPAPTGIYFAAGGQGVFYIPYQGQNAGYGMLGSATPQVYQAFGVPNKGSNSMGNYLDDLGVTVTSITFSANPDGVVVYKDPFTGVVEEAFQGGALFISYVANCGQYNQVEAPGCTGVGAGQGYLNNACVSSISMQDVCTGEVSKFVDNNVLGPVYTSIADVNMNLIVQNGQGGLSIFSVPYTPGFVQNLEWLRNEYYQNSCSCDPPNALFAEIIAAVALVLAIVALPELLPEVAAGAVAYATVAVATAGVAATFAPVANGGRRELLLPSSGSEF